MSNFVFPTVEFTTTEMNLIAEALTQPSVKKYLQSEAWKAAQAIVEGRPGEGEPDSEYLRRAAEVRGVLSALNLLLNIQRPEDAPKA